MATPPVNPSPPPSGVCDAAEAALRIKKLEIETQVLRQQANGKLFEWFKAVAGPAAVLSIAVTVFFGLKQLNEAHRARDDERFDKAVARLAGPTATERLSGIAGLGLYLEPQQSARHRATLRFLVSALAVETDPTVRSSLLDILSSLTPRNVGQDDLNDALERLRDRNRNLYAQRRSSFLTKWLHSGKTYGEVGSDETQIGQESEEEIAPLRATATAITTLIRNGAKTKDLSLIYCVGCDFTGIDWEMSNPKFAKISDFAHTDSAGILDLSGVNFDKAILKDANFVGVKLRGASFDSADLLHVNFSGADLVGAKLTDFERRHYIYAWSTITGANAIGMFPDFTCADLSGADFSQSDFFVIYSGTAGVAQGAYPILQNANLLDTNLKGVSVLTVEAAPPSLRSPSEQVEHFIFEGYEGGVGFDELNGPLGKKYEIDAFTTGPKFQFKDSLPQDFWLSTQDVFSNLNSARNVNKSLLPEGLKYFLQRNMSHFQQSPHPTPCTPRS